MYKILILCACLAMSLNCFAQNKIVILGDSLSDHYGILQEQSWVTLLSQRLALNYPSYEVVNASISGDTSAEGLQRLPKILMEHQPLLLLIELGGNDGMRGLSLSQIENNLSLIIQKAQDSGTKVLLMEIQLPDNYGELYNQKFVAIYKRLSEKFNVPLIPFLLQKIYAQADLIQEDRIHPKAEAEPIVFEEVWPYIQSELVA